MASSCPRSTGSRAASGTGSWCSASPTASCPTGWPRTARRSGGSFTAPAHRGAPPRGPPPPAPAPRGPPRGALPPARPRPAPSLAELAATAPPRAAAKPPPPRGAVEPLFKQGAKAKGGRSAKGAAVEGIAAEYPGGMPAYEEMMTAHQSIRRLGRPIDVAYAVLFLASDEADWITGVTLPVDGGYTAR